MNLTATHGNMLQYSATRNGYHEDGNKQLMRCTSNMNHTATPQHTAIHCNTLQHTAACE